MEEKFKEFEGMLLEAFSIAKARAQKGPGGNIEGLYSIIQEFRAWEGGSNKEYEDFLVDLGKRWDVTKKI